MAKKPTYKELEKRIQGLEQAESEHKQTEKQYLNQKNILRNIFASIEDGVYIVNQQYDIQYVNPVLVKEFGSYEGGKCYRYFHGLDKVCPWCKNQDVWAGKTVRWEWYSSKNKKTYDLIDTPMTLPDGSIGKLEIFRDITERKQMEDALKSSETEIKSIFRAAPIGIGVICGRTFQNVNNRFCEITGYSRAELIGQSVRMIYPSDEEYEYVGSEKYRMIKEKGTGTVETRFRHKSGEIINILLSSTQLDLTDLSVGVTFTALDITERKKTEDALKESERKFRLLADHTYDWEYWIDQDGDYVYISPACERITGYSSEEIISDPKLVPKMVKPGYAEKMSRHYQDENNKDTPIFSIEFPIIAKNGEEVWLEHNCSPVYDKQGNYVGRRGNNRDITDRKEAETALIRSERKWHNILINTPQIGISIDPKARIIFANYHFLLLTGWQEHEVIGQDWFDFFIPENIREEVRNIFSAVMIQKDNTGFSNYENEILTKTGELRNIAWANVLTKDTNGNIIDVTCLGIDLTERRRAENELKYQKELLQKIIDRIPAFITFYDPKINMLFVNKEFEDKIGWTNEEIQKIDIMEACYPDPEYREKAFHYMQKATSDWKEFVVTTKTGGKIESIWSNVKDDTGIQIGIGIDVTEKKQLEEQYRQAQKMESVGRLAGGVAHDFNNALSVIMSTTELAIDDVNPTGQLREDLDEILMAGKRAANITRQLLAFARKQTISPKVLDLNENVGNMLKMLRRLIGEDIDLAWLPGANLWSVKMDPTQIDQILANLCVNARDAIEGVGKLTIKTTTIILDDDYSADHIGFIPGEFVLLSVSDNGCGMNKEILDNIFEPFFTTKDVDKGTGLGLATVYGIVKQNNGFINVYSEPDIGTTIKIYLPRHETKAEKTHEENTEEIPTSKGETVLVVEDDLSILNIMQKILEGLGYTVLTSNAPEKTMGIVKEYTGRIHLLITDVIMPKMNGRDLAKQLQSICPDLKCVYMSGYTVDIIGHHEVLDKRVNFIQKPFSRRELAEIVRKMLDEN